jgi:dimethylargininase
MTEMFKLAILRRPAANFAAGQTTVDLGTPISAEVEKQFRQYCEALQRCGLALTVLDADSDHPDSTFVEDTAVLTRHSAIITRPGAPSRAGEVCAIKPIVERYFKVLHEIAAPGTMDGGDICEAENHFFIGISRRTNHEGALQLGTVLRNEGYTCSLVDIRAMRNILHLKSGIAYLGNQQLVIMEEMADRPEFAAYDLIRVSAEESYAANCIRVNDHVLMPSGYPLLRSELERRGYDVIALEMSEFQKMDGGLSCLSLRM